jgi:hypothetical protein
MIASSTKPSHREIAVGGRLVAAADGVGELGVALDTTAELRSCSASVRDLEPAISAGIVTLDEQTIRFRHPLIRSAIYQAASLTEQNDVHAALHLRLGGDPDRAVWHLAAATVGRDEHVASELEAAAARARRRGALGSAVEALRRAAQMSPGSTDRSRRLLSAALLAFELGRGDIVMPLLEIAESLELTALQKGRVRWIREMIDPKPFTATVSTHLYKIFPKLWSEYSPLSRLGAAQARSTPSRPRWISPAASSTILPCSEAMIRATSSVCSTSSCRKR